MAQAHNQHDTRHRRWQSAKHTPAGCDRKTHKEQPRIRNPARLASFSVRLQINLQTFERMRIVSRAASDRLQGRYFLTLAIRPDRHGLSHSVRIYLTCTISGKPAERLVHGTRSQTGGVGPVFRPESACTLTCFKAFQPYSETTAPGNRVLLWACCKGVNTRSYNPGLPPTRLQNKSTRAYSTDTYESKRRGA